MRASYTGARRTDCTSSVHRERPTPATNQTRSLAFPATQSPRLIRSRSVTSAVLPVTRLAKKTARKGESGRGGRQSQAEVRFAKAESQLAFRPKARARAQVRAQERARAERGQISSSAGRARAGSGHGAVSQSARTRPARGPWVGPVTSPRHRLLSLSGHQRSPSHRAARTTAPPTPPGARTDPTSHEPRGPDPTRSTQSQSSWDHVYETARRTKTKPSPTHEND